MSQSNPPPVMPALLTFLAGAAIGAIVVALTTPKSGPHLRRDLKNLFRRSRDRAHRAAEGMRGQGPRSRRTYVWHIPGAKGDHPVSVNDLPG